MVDLFTSIHERVLYHPRSSQWPIKALPPARHVSSPGGRTIHARQRQCLQLARRIRSSTSRQSPRSCPSSWAPTMALPTASSSATPYTSFIPWECTRLPLLKDPKNFLSQLVL